MYEMLQAEQGRVTRRKLHPADGTFFATADHFSRRGKQARTAEDRARFADSAKFYRALAAITPALPADYKPRGKPTQRFSAQAQRSSGRAEMCRAIADCLREEGPKLLLMRMGASYDQLANRAEN